MRNICMFACALACACTARAGVLFNSISTNASSGDPFRTPGWNVFSYGSSANQGVGVAASFTLPAGAYSLNSVSFALGYIEDTNNLAISLQADNSGHPSGTPLETMITHPTDINSLYQVATYNSSLNPVMAGGTKYWLVAEPIDLNVVGPQNNSAYAWYVSGILSDSAARNFDFQTERWANWIIQPNALLPAFRIDGVSVPEPTASSLLLIGAGFLATRGVKRQH